MDNEPNQVGPPICKLRWFQFRLRTLLIVVVAYVAFYAMAISAILSRDHSPKPQKGELKVVEAIRNAMQGIGEEICRNEAIVFTVAWLSLPIVVLAVGRSVSAISRRRGGRNRG